MSEKPIFLNMHAEVVDGGRQFGRTSDLIVTPTAAKMLGKVIKKS